MKKCFIQLFNLFDDRLCVRLKFSYFKNLGRFSNYSIAFDYNEWIIKKNHNNFFLSNLSVFNVKYYIQVIVNSENLFILDRFLEKNFLVKRIVWIRSISFHSILNSFCSFVLLKGLSKCGERKKNFHSNSYIWVFVYSFSNEFSICVVRMSVCWLIVKNKNG